MRSFTAEKASADFYQLSGRRINWDRTDYHPLLGAALAFAGFDSDTQTMAMHHPSVGYAQATEIREGIDRNFVVIFSDVGAKGGGGTLATFNRSIGPFEADRSDVSFLHSVDDPRPGGHGRAGATQGAYRSPFPLPDGRISSRYDADHHRSVGADAALRPRGRSIPTTGTRTAVAGFAGGGQSYVEAVLVYKREPRPLFNNLTQLVFGGHVDPSDPTHGTVHYPDLPMLGTLLGANLRTGRFVDALRAAHAGRGLRGPGAARRPGGGDGRAAPAAQMVYQNRKVLGTRAARLRRLRARPAAVADAAHRRAAGRRAATSSSP